MKVLDGGLELVPGYKFSNIECGIRYENRLDYSLIYSETECNASGLFTINKISAAPVKISRGRIENTVRAILINATNANACTGETGSNNAIKLSHDIAEKLEIGRNQVLLASTGIIGHQLPLEKMLNSHEMLVSSLSKKEGEKLPTAIMTTDTKPKSIAVSFTAQGRDYTIAGTAKGAGMIAPNMATLLSFIITDAPVKKETLDSIFKDKVDKTFNSLTIDGDTSTNDTAIMLSPVSERYLESKKDIKAFSHALSHVLEHLAKEIVSDGEGVNHSVRIEVINAQSSQDAKKIARSVSESLLVKTAIFGKDPNWGRIACAAGYSGAQIEEEKLSISFNGKTIFSNGIPLDFPETELAEILNMTEYTVTVDIGLGIESASMLTSDISYDYVKINAEYST